MYNIEPNNHGTTQAKQAGRLMKVTLKKSRNERKIADCSRSEATSFRSLANDKDF